MKVVFSGAQLAHAPENFLRLGRIVPYPDSPDRARALLEGARQSGGQIYAARGYDPKSFNIVHAVPYLKFLRTGYESWSKIEGAGPDLLPSIRPMHRPFARSTHILASAGMFLMDNSCPIMEGTWKAAMASANTALTAADCLLGGDNVVYALCRPPGHHAYAGRAAGFCYLNNAALAAQQLRTGKERIAVLDIDVHHGNGTQSIFATRPDVLTVSIHADPAEFYPFYYGTAAETGEAEGQGYNLNLPVPVGSGDDVWLTALDTALARIQDYAPGALVIALGLDGHEADPLKGGALTTAGLARLAHQIASLGLPTVIVQEGGYLTEHLSDNLAMFLTAYEGALEVPVNIVSPEAASEEVSSYTEA